MAAVTRSSVLGLLICLYIVPASAQESIKKEGVIFPVVTPATGICSKSIGFNKVVQPILDVDAPDGYGLDDRYRGVSYAIMGLGTSCSAGDKEACRAVYETSLLWAKAEAAKRSRAKSRNDSKFWNDTLTVNLYVAAPMMAAYSFAHQQIDIQSADQKLIKQWFATIVSRNEHLMHGEVYKGTTQAAGTPKSAHNHALVSAIAHMSLGILNGDDSMYRSAFANWRAAVSSQRKDGSMPIESRRGGRAIFYQGRAMTALAAMAVIAENQGSDLWSHNSGKRNNFHNIVKFFIDFSEQPEVVFKYAKEMFSPGPARDHTWQEVREGGAIFGWLAAYATRFPNHENIARIRNWDGKLNRYQQKLQFMLKSIDRDAQLADGWTIVEPICHYRKH